VKLLIAGFNSSGSWKIRGEQLGKAIGADFKNRPGDAEGYDAVVLVKRPDPSFVARLKAFKIWDIVDAWPQPHGNRWNREMAMLWLRERIRTIKPDAIVAPTLRMAEDCEEFNVPTLYLPHHGREAQELNPIRERVATVGYEGGVQYLGKWKNILDNACISRGWKFVTNPYALANLDIVVALREDDGYPVRRWKSNVKLANAQITGTPCILSPESGYLETQANVERFAENEKELNFALDELTDYQTRCQAFELMRRAAPSINAVSRRYSQWLHGLKF
jgi:hypothetical protein